MIVPDTFSERIQRCAYCLTCDEEVPATDTSAGCPQCGGRWVPMGDGEWSAFDGGDRVAHLERLLAEAKRARQRANDLAALKAWNAAMEAR